MSDKKKFRFNILDVIIILVVVACLAGAAVRYSLPAKLGITPGGNKEAIVTFFVENVRTDTIDALIEGDEYFSKEHDTVFGTLYNVAGFQIEPHVVYGEDSNGLVRSSTINHRSDLIGYFKVKGMETDRGFLLNNSKKIAPGDNIEIYSSNRRMTILVENISVEE